MTSRMLMVIVGLATGCNADRLTVTVADNGSDVAALDDPHTPFRTIGVRSCFCWLLWFQRT